MKKILILFLCASLADCGATSVCSQPAHVNDAKCIATSALVDCTTPAAINAVIEFAPVVLSLISRLTGSDGAIDWSTLNASLASLGVADAACILTTIGQDLAKPKQGGPGLQKTVETFEIGFDAWKRAKLPPGVAIRLSTTP